MKKLLYLLAFAPLALQAQTNTQLNYDSVGIAKSNVNGGAVTMRAARIWLPQLTADRILYNSSVGKLSPVIIGSGLSFSGGTLSYSGSPGGVTSFNSRTGAVVPLVGDYSSFYAPVSGSSNYIRNGLTLQTAAGFNIDGEGSLLRLYATNEIQAGYAFSYNGVTSNVIDPTSITTNAFRFTGIGSAAFRIGTDKSWNLDMYNTGTPLNAINVSETGVITTTKLDNYASNLNASFSSFSKITKGYGDSVYAHIGSPISLNAIGSTPNANGATLTGPVLNLQPASVYFGGVITTGTQNISGNKSLYGDLNILSGSSLTVDNGTGDISSVTNNTISVNSSASGGAFLSRDNSLGGGYLALTNAGATATSRVLPKSGSTGAVSMRLPDLNETVTASVWSIIPTTGILTKWSGTAGKMVDAVPGTDYLQGSSFSGTLNYQPRVIGTSPYMLGDSHTYDNGTTTAITNGFSITGANRFRQGNGWTNTTDSVNYKNTITSTGIGTAVNIGVQNINSAGASNVALYNDAGVTQMYIRAHNSASPFYPGLGQIGSPGTMVVTGGGVDIAKFTSTGFGVGLPTALGNTPATAIVDAIDTRTMLTSGATVVKGTHTGTYNTTAGALTGYAGYFTNSSTRSSGSNSLANYGIFAEAFGGQVNWAARFGSGSVIVENAANFGSAVTPTHPVTIASGTLGMAILNNSDVTNYERLILKAAANVYSIIPEIGGTGVLRPIMMGSTQGQFQMSGSGVAVGNSGAAKVAITAGSTSLGYPVEASTGALIGSSGIQRGFSALSHFNGSGTVGSVGFFIGKYNQANGSGINSLISANILASANTGTPTEVFRVSDLGTTTSRRMAINWLTAGSAGTDSILVHDNTTDEIRAIPSNYYATTASIPTATLTRGYGLTGSNYTPSSAATFAVDSTVIRTVANSLSLAQLQTRLNGFWSTTASQSGIEGDKAITSGTYTFGSGTTVNTYGNLHVWLASTWHGNAPIQMYNATNSFLVQLTAGTQTTGYGVVFPNKTQDDVLAMVSDGGGAIANTTTIALSSATLNSTYTAVPVGYRVICGSITLGGVIYTKYTEAGSSDVWLTTAVTITP